MHLEENIYVHGCGPFYRVGDSNMPLSPRRE